MLGKGLSCSVLPSCSHASSPTGIAQAALSVCTAGTLVLRDQEEVWDIYNPLGQAGRGQHGEEAAATALPSALACATWCGCRWPPVVQGEVFGVCTATSLLA